MNNAVGRAPVEEMIGAGIHVGLGNDGFSMNMLQEMKAAYLLHKFALNDPRVMPADLVLKMAFFRECPYHSAGIQPFLHGFSCCWDIAGRCCRRYRATRLCAADTDEWWKFPLASHFWYGWTSCQFNNGCRTLADAQSPVVDCGRGAYSCTSA